jgi:hypothetical protein
MKKLIFLFFIKIIVSSKKEDIFVESKIVEPQILDYFH